ncbi:glycoside hydrolase family protein [Burkholderia vietnamiensis]|uniref:glycoside hydrolase family protein n=1 Tax=Burkholderia vietnamiensis TaxID=60552 RepID=UPI0015890C1C|nr:glycoside hydrolase family protein [Burkholderia vietnamiensis]
MNLDLMDKELRRDEGVRYVRYLDSRGIPTTGVGHNLSAAPLPAEWSFPLNDTQVNQLLNHDLAVTLAGLDLHLPWWRKLDEVRQRVIANMAFNMGVDKLLGFKNTLAAVQRGAYAVAAAGMKASRWYSQVGQRAVRLRMAMETGVMPAA